MIWLGVCMGESLGFCLCWAWWFPLTWIQAVGIRHGMEVLLVEREDDIEEDCSGTNWR